jgi:hypothetical protein
VITRAFNEITDARLREVCEQRTNESRTLDFKRELPGTNDRGRHDLLKDVCALANADGGDLVYGIEDEHGQAVRISPITTEAADAAMRRLSQVVDSGIEPRLPSIHIRDVPLAVGGYVLIIRVPASFNGPHRYRFNDHTKFFMRNGTHNTELTYDQLRTAFDRTATLGQRAHEFRAHRLTEIREERTWQPMRPGPLCVVHIIPLSSMRGGQQIDIAAAHTSYSPFMFRDWRGASPATNLDGLIVHPPPEDGRLVAYTQIFRNGAVEAVDFGAILHDARPLIPSVSATAFFRDAIDQYLRELARHGISGPAVVAGALLNVVGYTLGIDHSRWMEVPRTADRPHLVLPEHWVEDVSAQQDPDVVAHPMLDILWQSFGLERCRLYDAAGRWTPR